MLVFEEGGSYGARACEREGEREVEIMKLEWSGVGANGDERV